MTPGQFYELDEAEQAETVWAGVHIADREDKEHNILLYRIDDLYVEVFHHKNYNVISKFRPFNRYELLDFYLDKIGIKYLLEQ